MALMLACALELLIVAFAVRFPLEAHRIHCASEAAYDAKIPEGTVHCFGHWLLYGLGLAAQIPVTVSWCLCACIRRRDHGGEGGPINMFSAVITVWMLLYGIQLFLVTVGSVGSEFAHSPILPLCWVLLVGVLVLLCMYVSAVGEAMDADAL